MSDTLSLWVGRLVIVVIIIAIGYFIGMFIASTQKKANESVAADAQRTSKYEKIGAASGAVISAIWLLYVAGKDHKQKSSYETQLIRNNNGKIQSLVTTPFAI